MRLIRTTALAAGALALTTLAGCGLTHSDDHSDSATASNPALTTAATPAAPASSASSAQDATSATSTSPASTPAGGATASSDPATDAAGEQTSAAAMSSAAAAPVVRYADKTGLLQLPVSSASLPGSPAGLRDFARDRLKKMWHDQFQGAPGCEGIAQVQIKRANTAAAFVEASWGAMTSTCPQYAGNPGSWEIWGDQGGTWAVVLTGEGLASCADLTAHRIPRVVYPTCSDGTHKVPNPVA